MDITLANLTQIYSIWGALSKNVHANGIQYRSVSELTQALMQKSADLSTKQIRHCICSGPNRCLKLIKEDDEKIWYLRKTAQETDYTEVVEIILTLQINSVVASKFAYWIA